MSCDLPRHVTPTRLALLFAALSLCAWLLPLWAAGVLLTGSLALGAKLGLFERSQRTRLRAYTLFLLFWGFSTFLLQMIAGGLAARVAAASAGELILRLSALAALTLDLNLLMTPFALARVLAGLTRPWLGEARAERAALALAVMLRLIPQAGHCLRTLQNTRKLRCQGFSAGRQLSLVSVAALRNLSLLTWRQSLALAARDVHLAAEIPPAAPQREKE